MSHRRLGLLLSKLGRMASAATRVRDIIDGDEIQHSLSFSLV
jgi:hypothetical protein